MKTRTHGMIEPDEEDYDPSPDCEREEEEVYDEETESYIKRRPLTPEEEEVEDRLEMLTRRAEAKGHR